MTDKDKFIRSEEKELIIMLIFHFWTQIYEKEGDRACINSKLLTLLKMAKYHVGLGVQKTMFEFFVKLFLI